MAERITRTEKSSQKKCEVLRKALIIFLVLLLVGVVFLSYLLVVEKRKTNKVEHDHEEGRPTVCTEKNCILNSADILTKMDSTVDPCEDFYGYACGTYEKATPIPSNLKSTHVLLQLQQSNRKFLKSLIENPKFRKQYSKNIPVTKLFHAYDTCADVNKINSVGTESYKELIEEVGGSNITSPHWDPRSYDVFNSLLQVKRHLNLDTFIRTGARINPKNNTKYVFFVWPTKLGLKSLYQYYDKTRKGHQIRHSYKNYMIKMMKDVQHNSKSNIKVLMDEVFNLEKHIAKIYLKFSGAGVIVTIDKLSKHTKFDWLSYIRNLKGNIDYSPDKNDMVSVQSMDMLKHIIQLVNKTNTRIVSNYIAWTVFRDVIPALPEYYTRTQQAFQNSIQSRPTEMPKRWETCIKLLCETLPIALSYLYVDQKFSSQSRDWAQAIFEEIRKEFINDLQNKRWMDATTKREATEKVRGISFLVGFDDDLKSLKKLEKFHDGFSVNSSDFFLTFLNMQRFQFETEMKKFRGPVRKNSFNQITSDANAYYSREENKISFLAGILQRPFYDKGNSRSSNYGALGMFVGHELTHAFDSNGHKYDKEGDLRDWWTKYSLRNFINKSKCFVEQYDNFIIYGQQVNGRKTLAECIADNGGLKLAYKAYKSSERKTGEEPRLPGLNLTNDQVFFLSFAQSWCSKYTLDGVKEVISRRVPMMFRATGALRNSIDFSKAYQCPLGSKMNPKLKCDLW